jgi:HD-GYP domain-containing protein (c-di-GMP phosphodiesterase class II)
MSGRNKKSCRIFNKFTNKYKADDYNMEEILMQPIDFHEFSENLIKVLEKKDIYTAGHSDRVAEISFMLSKTMGLSERHCAFIHVAAHLHDIGKIGIPDGILLKTGKLSNAEFRIIQEHPVIGAEIFENNSKFNTMSKIILHHHERYDGKGYPNGLLKDQIPLGSSIIAVCDAFDAMTTARSYRQNISIDNAIKEIKTHRESQFHPEAVDAVLCLYNQNRKFLSEIAEPSFKKDSFYMQATFNSVKTAD